MNSWAVRGWLLFAAALALAYGGWISYRVGSDEPQSAGPARAAAAEKHAGADHSANPEKLDRPLADFTLTDQTGESFGTADLRGQVWVASFFFASCPGTCRQLNFALKDVADEVPADVRLVSITCDPDIDTPETLARYAETFSADPQRWKFLTGKMTDLERIANEDFQVALKKQEHTERAFVVDRQGHVRGRFNVLDPDQVPKLAALVKRLDAEPAAGMRE
jgi:cytochrome oxidase Cu insertion factor (SCO1/SenC/PrrC family)